jgi:hypothetical protein
MRGLRRYSFCWNEAVPPSGDRVVSAAGVDLFPLLRMPFLQLCPLNVRFLWCFFQPAQCSSPNNSCAIPQQVISCGNVDPSKMVWSMCFSRCFEWVFGKAIER